MPLVSRFLSTAVFRTNVTSAGMVALIIRLVVGIGFLQHGIAKIVNGPDKFALNLAGLGVPYPELMAPATVVFEVGCGLAMIAGLLVPIVVVPMAAILAVALFTVHLRFGFSSIKLQAVTADGIKFGPPGYEVILLYLVCLAALVVFGAGPYSIDAWLRQRVRPTGSK
jgi:putative oxidoreductase